MDKKKKEEIPVRVSSVSSEGFAVDEAALTSFIANLIETFKDKGAFLEAKRLSEAKDKVAELDLILNDEEHCQEYQIYQQIKNVVK